MIRVKLCETLDRELEDAPGHNVDMARISWPAEVGNGTRALEVVSRVMSAIYCISLASVTIALILAIFSIFLCGRLSACANILSSLTATLAVGVASILATVIGDQAADLINEKGPQIGISAQKGTKFLNLTWFATVCMLFASFIWF